MRLKLTLSYDGAGFYGSQRQKRFRTIQGELEKAIYIVEKKEITIKTAGRTDRGVHATGQVAMFDSERQILPVDYKRALNSLLPEDIRVSKIEQMPDNFDPRRDATRRDYLYRIKVGSYNPFLARYALQIEKMPDLDAMKRAAEIFIGTHNFRAFSVGYDKISYVTTVLSSYIKVVRDWIYYKISAVAFFRHMVRRIVGLLLDIGRGRFSPETVEQFLAGNAPQVSAVKAAGLILRRVRYD